MIAGAFDSWSLDKLPFGWFDVVFVAFLAFGLFRGRRNGLTKEFGPTFRWITIVLAGGLGYEFAGQILNNFFGLDRAVYLTLGYLAVAFLVFVAFIPVDGFLNTRLAGSNFFGGAEYYLGIFAGVVRYLCIILFCMALMNAPYYTAADIRAQKESAFQTFGGGQQGFTGDFFPTFQQVQEGVFKKSFVGPLITDHLGVILINTVPASDEKAPVNPPGTH